MLRSYKEKMPFDKCLPIILKFEGGYVNHPDDPGGATNKGITQKTYNTYRKLWKKEPQSVRFIEDSEVTKIYESYWKQSRASQFAEKMPLTALVHFDFAVNAGFKQAAKTLQRALGLELVDGIIGNRTLTALYLSDDYETAMMYCEERFEFYHRLVELKPQLKTFMRGWLWRVKHLKGIVDDWSYRSKPKDNLPSIT